MVRIVLNKHEDLENDLKVFISALLPHENGDTGYYNIILEQVTKLIHIEEMEGEYFLMFSIAEQLSSSLFRFGAKPIFSRDLLIRILTADLRDIVSEDGHGFGRMLAGMGMRGDNLKDVDAYQAAATEAMNRCVELYDEAFEMKIPPEEAMSYIVSLRGNYKTAIMQEALAVQGELAYNTFDLSEKKWEPWRAFLRRQRFSGSDGWLDFIGYIHSELSRRIRESEIEMRVLSSLEDAERLKQDSIERSSPIASYGIPLIDEKRQIMKTRYVVLIGKPNLGKTTIAVNWLVNVLLEGRKVAMYSEETPESVMLYEYVLPVYIFKKYGFFASYEQIIGEEPVGGIDAQEISEREKMIKMAICDIVESGNYLYVPALNAWNIYNDLSRIHAEFPFEYIVIDHSLSIHGGGETTERLNALSSGLKAFKNDYKTSICLLSHPSPDAKKIVSRAGASGLTKYSKQIEGDADDIFYMFDTPELEEKNLIGFIHTKGRGASKVLDIVYLTKMFEFKCFMYDPEVQVSYGQANQAMDDIMSNSDLYDDIDEVEGEYDAGNIDF